MSTVHDPMKDKITCAAWVHSGPTSGRSPQCLAPELPRGPASITRPSTIIDSIFEYLVLAGSMENINYYEDRSACLGEMTREGHEHSSAGQACGGRGLESPWACHACARGKGPALDAGQQSQCLRTFRTGRIRWMTAAWRLSFGKAMFINGLPHFP